MFIFRKRFLYLYLLIGICLKADESANSSKALIEVSVGKQTVQFNASSDFLPKISNNPKVNVLLLGGIVASSAIIWWKVHINRILKDGWNSWRLDLSLRELQQISEQQLYDQLCEFINMRYVDSSASEQRQQFLTETSNEIISLRNYVQLGSSLYKFKLGLLFFISEKSLQRAKTGIKKLQYMRRIFVKLFQQTARGI